jgi:predicted ABC-type transport system involved in lysophospholipase L1 biosynthesis ATPase subunit
MIDLKDVHLTLTSAAGPVRILRGVDLAVADGASLSVVGPSGSGKSSLLAIVGGIERATSGRVVVDGVDLATLDEDGLALFRRDRVGILFQSFHLIPTLTAQENVALPLELKGAPRAEAAAAAEAEAEARAAADPLSEREREVLRLLALGHTNQEIAKMLYISVRTAETHRAHIMQKLRLATRAELVRYALQHGLLEEEPPS